MVLRWCWCGRRYSLWWDDHLPLGAKRPMDAALETESQVWVGRIDKNDDGDGVAGDGGCLGCVSACISLVCARAHDVNFLSAASLFLFSLFVDAAGSGSCRTWSQRGGPRRRGGASSFLCALPWTGAAHPRGAQGLLPEREAGKNIISQAANLVGEICGLCAEDDVAVQEVIRVLHEALPSHLANHPALPCCHAPNLADVCSLLARHLELSLLLKQGVGLGLAAAVCQKLLLARATSAAVSGHGGHSLRLPAAVVLLGGGDRL